MQRSGSAMARWWILGGLVVVVVVVVGLFVLQQKSGIRVTIQNAGSTTMRSVVLHVTGASYPLGDLVAGAVVTEHVQSTGESSLMIVYGAPDGVSVQLDVDSYFESGYRGTIDVSVNEGSIEKNEEDIKIW